MANRKQIFLLSAALAAATGVGGATPTWAQTAEVKVGLIAPMSGPWARQGDLMLKGAQLAIDDINQAGGIAAMGGAKMKLVVFDAGDTVEKAKNTAQRMVAQEPDLVGATGAWLSSFTLGVTEVTERADPAAHHFVLFGSDYRAWLQIRVPDLADRWSAGEKRDARSG